MPMPRSRATVGEVMATSRPSISTLPLLGGW